MDFFRKVFSLARYLQSHFQDLCDDPEFIFNRDPMDFFTKVLSVTMEFFKEVLSWVGLLAPPPPRPNALEFSTLNNLPLEIIRQISRLLPPESAASFSICCRPLYLARDTRYLEDLRPTEGSAGLHRERLLKLLERDLPDHIICTSCKRLHAITKARRYLHSNYDYFNYDYFNYDYFNYDYFNPLKCWKADYESWTRSYIHPEFSMSVFQMTMKRYRQGLEYSDLLDLLSLKTTTTHHYREYVEQQTAAAKLINGSLVIREQKIFMIQAGQAIPHFEICHHISFFTSEDMDDYLRDIGVSDWKVQKGSQNRERVVRCRYCRSEYQIDFEQFGRRGNAMYVTKWLDLGKDPLEHTFQSHLLPLERQIKFATGSICTAFEGRGQFDFDSDAVTNSKQKRELFKKSSFSGSHRRWSDWLCLLGVLAYFWVCSVVFSSTK